MITTAEAAKVAIAEFLRFHELPGELIEGRCDRVYEALGNAIDGDIRTAEDALAIIAAVIALANANDGNLESDDRLALERAHRFLVNDYVKRVSS